MYSVIPGSLTPGKICQVAVKGSEDFGCGVCGLGFKMCWLHIEGRSHRLRFEAWLEGVRFLP